MNSLIKKDSALPVTAEKLNQLVIELYEAMTND